MYGLDEILYTHPENLHPNNKVVSKCTIIFLLSKCTTVFLSLEMYNSLSYLSVSKCTIVYYTSLSHFLVPQLETRGLG